MINRKVPQSDRRPAKAITPPEWKYVSATETDASGRSHLWEAANILRATDPADLKPYAYMLLEAIDHIEATRGDVPTLGGRTYGQACILITPCPDHHWQVSKILNVRRSTSEAEFVNLADTTLSLPKDATFYPHHHGLT